MDTIKFIIEDFVDREYGIRFPSINIYINNKNLLDLIRQVEQGHGISQGVSDSAYQKSYVGLLPGYYPYFEDEFLGRVKRSHSIVLICTCLEEVCDSIVVQVVFEPDTVIWRDITNPFFGVMSEFWVKMQEADEADGFPIDYSGIGAFVFDKIQYLDALEQLKQSI